jgi:hypothetical protein
VRILDDVAGNVRQLEGQPEVAGAVEHPRVADTHDGSHHQPDHTGHVVAVAQRVLDGFVARALDVHREAGQVVVGEARRDPGHPGMAQRHFLEGGKSRVPHLLAGIGAAGQLTQFGQPRRGIELLARRRIEAQLLAVDHVVAMAAPGIQHQHAAPHGRVEQPGRGGEAFRTDRDRLGGVIQQLVAHARTSSCIA